MRGLVIVAIANETRAEGAILWGFGRVCFVRRMKQHRGLRHSERRNGVSPPASRLARRASADQSRSPPREASSARKRSEMRLATGIGTLSSRAALRQDSRLYSRARP